MAVKKRSIGKTIMASALVLFGGFLIISSSIYIYLSPKLPSIEELKDVLLQITGYCGFPAGVESFRLAKEVLNEQKEK